ncbi:MAG: hypothetical protein AAF383_19675 [Cyanobacteria bacterium P01_A01_bin.83]
MRAYAKFNLMNRHHNSLFTYLSKITEQATVNKGWLESIRNQVTMDNSELNKTMLPFQSIAERFTGIERMNQALLESQNIFRDGFANSGLNKELLESISSESVIAESKFKELKQLIDCKNVINALSELKKTWEIEKLAQSSLSKFAFEDVGKLISLSDNSKNLVLREFDGLASAYIRLTELRNTEVLNAFPFYFLSD